MAVKFDWYDAEKMIGLYELGENWTWNEVHQIMAESWAQISKVSGIVDSIMISKSLSLPPSAMTHLRTISQNRPLNTGIIAMVGASVFQQSMIKMFTLVYSSTLRREVPIIFADSVEEAYELLLAAKSKREKLVS